MPNYVRWLLIVLVLAALVASIIHISQMEDDMMIERKQFMKSMKDCEKRQMLKTQEMEKAGEWQWIQREQWMGREKFLKDTIDKLQKELDSRPR